MTYKWHVCILENNIPKSLIDVNIETNSPLFKSTSTPKIVVANETFNEQDSDSENTFNIRRYLDLIIRFDVVYSSM